MNPYSSLCDDFYVNMNLGTEMELPANRETVLHFFERIQKTYPTMRNFYCRERGDFVLEEDKDQGNYRWCTIEPRRVCSGQVNPETIEDALEQHRLVLETGPLHPLGQPVGLRGTRPALRVRFHLPRQPQPSGRRGVGGQSGHGADGRYARRDHHQPRAVADVALDEECRLQCRLSVETRTNAYQIRTGDFPEEQLSVYVTARQYGSLGPNTTFVETLARLGEVCREMIENHVIEQILNPLARTISLK